MKAISTILAMIAIFGAATFVILAVTAALASEPRHPKKAEACHGWKDAAGSCHWEPETPRGLGGSGMGPRGMVGRCGGRQCD